MIFPLLWLGLLHMFTLMLRALREERAHSMRAHVAKRAQMIESATSVAQTTYAVAPQVNRAPQQSATTDKVDPAETGIASIVVQHEQQDETVVQRTRNGWAQTHEGLTQFLEECTLTETVKDVAAMLLRQPHLTQVHVAQQLHVDRSTVCRRWKSFVTAAEDEGFTVPPLPQSFDTDTELLPARELQPA